MLVAIAAGCGGGGKSGTTTTTSASNVSGKVTFFGVWTRHRADDLPEGHRRLQQAVPEGEDRLQAGGQQPQHRPRDEDHGRQSSRHRGHRPAGLREAARAAGTPQADQLREERDLAELRAAVAQARLGQRDALRARLQGVQQVDALVQRPGLQAGRCQPAAHLDAADGRREDDQGVGHARLVALRGVRLDAHRPVREHLPPALRAGEVRRPDRPHDQVDGPVGDEGPHVHEGHRRRHLQHRGRGERCPPDRLPDVRGQGLRRHARGGDGARGRLRVE